MICIFCEIVAGRAPADILYRDEVVTVFRDRHPIAATHLLVVPNRHIESLNDLGEEDEALAGHLLLVARQMAAQAGVAEGGYRLLLNTGAGGGQTVFHLHLHVIAGKMARFVLG